MFGVGVGVRVGGQRFGSGVAPYVGLLDTYPGAAAAYSVRLLKSDYTGNAIRVRRSSDNAEQNIGFDGSGNLDTTALTSFCSGTNGFVTTWYDQSGNANNATQSTAANQPQIVSAGSIINQNSKPTIKQFSGNNLVLNTFFTFTDAFFTLKNDAQAVINYFIESNTNSLIGGFFNNGTFSGINGFGGFDGTNARSLTGEDFNRHLAYYRLDGSKINVSVDNSSLTDIGTFSPSLNVSKLLGRQSGLSLEGNAQEMIFYNSNQSSNRTAINTNINTYYGIY
jgi:hypothetical protein